MLDSQTNYKSLKGNIKSIFRNGVDYAKFNNAIYRSNDLVFICYLFMNSYILYCFNNGKEIPTANRDFIRMAFKSLSKKSNGPKPKGEKVDILTDLNIYFEKEFVFILENKNKKDFKITDIENHKFDSSNLSYIINGFEDEMETMIKNNISNNFCKYVNQYVNQNFILKNVARIPKGKYDLLSVTKKIEYKEALKNQKLKNDVIFKELEKVKNDLFEKTSTADKKYKNWIELNRPIIFPKLESNSLSYEDDLDINCFKYLKHMLVMNSVLEKNGNKMFSAFPLRTQMTDKYVTFNTSALKDIFGEVNSGLTNEQIWDKYFNVKKDYFNKNLQKWKLKDHSFNYQISTDGFSVSINFIKNSKIEGKNKSIQRRSEGSKKTKNLLKGKTPIEYKKIMFKINEDKKEATIKKKEENKMLKNKMAEEFKKK